MTLLERFLQYVQIDTESVPDVERYPSSEKQKVLLSLLKDQLVEMGVSATMDEEYGYVYARIPSNVGNSYKLGFISHVDTSPAVSGKDVTPVITRDYDGKDVQLADGRVLSPKEYPELLKHVGQTVISSDGRTLLGADDKAGVSVIMQAVQTIMSDPSLPHCEICVAFTPDEEVGRGTDYFDVAKFGADGAYTVDGGGLGELEYENFNAADAKVRVTGKSVHPGSAKGIMINANLVLMDLQSMLPVEQNPAYTEGYEGFFYLDSMKGECDHAEASYIIRDHDMNKFLAKKKTFESIVNFLNEKYGAGTVSVEIKDSYYNMKEKIQPHIHLVHNAEKAMQMAGVESVVVPIRGGTDGARLSYEGLPCPNLFTGGHNFHGRYEFAILEDMEKSLQTMLNLVSIYAHFCK